MTEIILPWDARIVKTNPDLELSTILEDKWLWLKKSIDELQDLLEAAKEHKSVEALKVRLELIKHVQALHWSKASLKNLNIWIFIHPWKDDRLTH